MLLRDCNKVIKNILKAEIMYRILKLEIFKACFPATAFRQNLCAKSIMKPYQNVKEDKNLNHRIKQTTFKKNDNYYYFLHLNTLFKLATKSI